MYVLFGYAYLAFQIGGFFCAYQAAARARTAQGATGWVIFLIAAPVPGVIAYLFLGHSRISDYEDSRRKSERVSEGVREYGERFAPDAALGAASIAYSRIAELPLTRGNRTEVLIDGTATFDAIFAALDAAENYILAQFYIIKDDDLGREFQARLIAAAERGVRVRLLFDQVGSGKLPAAWRDRLVAAGAEVLDPAKGRGPRQRLQINYRNHRKTIVIDGKVGFTGGLNVGDEYMGRSEEFGPWRDTHIRLDGPVVSQLQLLFVEDWHWMMRESIIDDLNWDATLFNDGSTALIVGTGPADDFETGAHYFFAMATDARERLWIASPYFVPDLDIRTALKHAAMRGVDVRILVPDVIDHKIPWLAAFAFFDQMRAAGVRIFRYTDSFMHQKVALVDDRIASVGTTNLDNRSFRLNFEATAMIFASDVAAEVEEMLIQDFSRSFELEKQLSEQPWYIKRMAPVARLFAPLL
ncbi:MAG: cardiolipin synthase [Rhodobacteraceae bacterium]|nr:cardiolipin synthase [Paracoccaceae bacterium]